MNESQVKLKLVFNDVNNKTQTTTDDYHKNQAVAAMGKRKELMKERGYMEPSLMLGIVYLGPVCWDSRY